jgi:hypothetical protein
METNGIPYVAQSFLVATPLSIAPLKLWAERVESIRILLDHD